MLLPQTIGSFREKRISAKANCRLTLAQKCVTIDRQKGIMQHSEKRSSMGLREGMGYRVAKNHFYRIKVISSTFLKSLLRIFELEQEKKDCYSMTLIFKEGLINAQRK